MGLKALTNFRIKVLKMRRSSKLLSVLGTSDLNKELALWLSTSCYYISTPGPTRVPGRPAGSGLCGLTQHGQPARHRPIHLVQDENDHQVDDGRGGFDRQLHVAARDWIRAHVESRFGGDPVEDDPKHGGKGDSDLFTGAQM